MPAEHVQTKREIEELFDRRGIRPRKRFGQHFLIDGNLMRRLVESAELEPGDTVLEVGAGTGGLTDLLAVRAARVIAVEIDDDMYGILHDRFQGRENVELIHGDVLAGKHHLLPAVEQMLRPPTVDGGVKLVANLPYDAATPLLMNLLVDYPRVGRLCFTVQAEVGNRITAEAGSKSYGPLSIIVQTLGVVQTVARLGPHSFWPRPQVDSVMLRVDRREPSALSGEALTRFCAFVHGAFSHRRKTLRSSLEYVVDAPVRERLARVIDVSQRPEQVPASMWLQMSAMLTEDH